MGTARRSLWVEHNVKVGMEGDEARKVNKFIIINTVIVAFRLSSFQSVLIYLICFVAI